jgi:DNA repair exonuclease SbcCD nuclease subunit
MTLLLCADLHLTSKPRDEDRWKLFPWLCQQMREKRIDDIAILGDLTDAKDRHDSILVNRLVANLKTLAKVGRVFILRGNHDFIDEQHPFFRFLHRPPDINYINTPTLHFFHDFSALFIPCTRDGELFKRQAQETKQPEYILTHQTYDGCLSENGTKLNGIPPSVFKDYPGRVWSGDIHTPQKVGKKIEYVGAPYPIKFGDLYKPRCVLLSATGSEDLHFPFQQKLLVEIGSGEMLPLLPEGAQIKLRVHLRRRDLADWRSLRAGLQEQALAAKLDLVSIEPAWTPERAVRASEEVLQTQSKVEIVKDYAQRKKLDKALTAYGVSLLS